MPALHRQQRSRAVGPAARSAVEALEQRTLFAVVTTLTDPFTAPAVDTAKWAITNRGLEQTGDAGYAQPTQDANGLVLGGMTSQQYWYGKSLESVDTLASTAPTTVSVDRVSISGSGSAYRSSLWLLQPGGPYLHFAENVNEGGWQYNPNNTGSGTAIGAFNTAAGNDHGLHKMKVVYTPLGGTNARFQLYLDDILGATVNYTNWNNATPFKTIVTGQARAGGDTVTATFKNFSAVAGPAPTQAPVAPTGLSVTTAPSGTNAVNASLSWTDNATDDLFHYVERSTDGVNFTQVAQLAGVAGTGGTVTYADNDKAASGVVYSYRVRAFNSFGPGTYSTYSNVASTVPTGATRTTLADPLTGAAVDTTKWAVTNRGLEQTGDAGYADPTQDANGLVLGGTTTKQYWYGKSLESKGLFSSKDPTTVSVDRVSLTGAFAIGSAIRSSLWIRQPGGQFLHFSENFGEGGWQFNQTTGGGGTLVPSFNAAAGDQALHAMKLVYKPLGGTNAAIEIYLDDTLGATANFTNWDNNVPFEAILTGQARAIGDSVSATFKNFSAVATPATTAPAAPSTLTATVTPGGTGLNVNLQWTDNSGNENGFAVERSTDGTTFTQVASVAQSAGTGGTLTYAEVAPAAGTTFTYRVKAFNSFNGGSSSAPSNTAAIVTPAAITSLVDPFTGSNVDTTKWLVTNRGLEQTGDGGYADPSTDEGGLRLTGIASAQYWYGKSLESKGLFASSTATTVSVTRVELSGTGSAYRSSLWLRQPTANGQFLHFSQNLGETGWSYNQTGGGSGTAIPAFNTAAADGGSHEMKLVYRPLGGTNAAVDMYLDGVQGPTATFANWDNSVPFQVIVTGQARATGDTVAAVFKNLNATVASTTTPSWLSAASQATWDPATKVLNVTGNATIVADPGADAPKLQVGTGGVLTISPSAAGPVNVGGVQIADGGRVTLVSVGAGRTATNHRVLVVAAGGPFSVVGGTLDLADNDLIVRNANAAAAADTTARVSALIRTAYAGTAWNGKGITSSAAAADPNQVTALGLMLNNGADASVKSTFSGQAVGSTDVLVKYTYYGDADLNGVTNAVDYGNIDFNQGSAGFWSAGDYDYNGLVNAVDYGNIDFAFLRGTGGANGSPL